MSFFYLSAMDTQRSQCYTIPHFFMWKHVPRIKTTGHVICHIDIGLNVIKRQSVSFELELQHFQIRAHYIFDTVFLLAVFRVRVKTSYPKVSKPPGQLRFSAGKTILQIVTMKFFLFSYRFLFKQHSILGHFASRINNVIHYSPSNSH